MEGDGSWWIIRTLFEPYFAHKLWKRVIFLLESYLLLTQHDFRSMASTFTALPSGYVLSPSLLVWVASQVGFYSDLVGRVGDADLTWVVDKVLVVGCCLLLSNALYIFDMRCFPWGISDIQKGLTSSSSFDILTTRTSDFSKKEPLQEQLGINADKPSLGHFWQRLLQERMETQQGVPSILHIDIVYRYIIWTH